MLLERGTEASTEHRSATDREQTGAKQQRSREVSGRSSDIITKKILDQEPG